MLAAVGIFRRTAPAPRAQRKARIAVVVAARNEEAVIGHLTDSLLAQDYPRDRFDVIVAPNNCTDKTADVAREHGAELFFPCLLYTSHAPDARAELVKSHAPRRACRDDERRRRFCSHHW